MKGFSHFLPEIGALGVFRLQTDARNAAALPFGRCFLTHWFSGLDPDDTVNGLFRSARRQNYGISHAFVKFSEGAFRKGLDFSVMHPLSLLFY